MTFLTYIQARSGAAVEMFSPRGLADGDQLAHLSRRERQRYAAHDPAPRTARSSSRSTLSSSTSAAQRRLSSWPKHHPDHSHRLLLRQYPCLSCFIIISCLFIILMCVPYAPAQNSILTIMRSSLSSSFYRTLKH